MNSAEATSTPVVTGRRALPVVLIQADTAVGEAAAVEHVQRLYGPDCETVVVHDTSPAAICETARQQRAVGVVLVVADATERRHPSGRIARIVRASPCPVVLVTHH